MTPLSQQFARQTQRLLAGFSLAIGTVVVIGLAVGTWLSERHDVEAVIEILATRVEADLDSLGNEIRSLAASPILWTGLTDDRGRQGYLEPLLRELNRSSQRTYGLYDYRGRPAIDGTPPPEVQNADLMQVLASGTGRRIGYIGADGTPRIALLVPVVSPQADSAIGVIIGTYAPLRSLASSSIRLSRLDRVLVRFSEDEQAHDLASQFSIHLHRPVWAVSGTDGSPVELHVYRPLGSVLLTVLVGAAILLSFLGMLRYAVRRWATQTGERLTERLDRLTEVCLRIGGGERLLPHPDPSQDEIGVLTRVLREAIQAQIRLAEQLEPASMVLRNVQEGVVMTDENGHITEVNPAFMRMTGWREDDLVGRQAGLLYHSVESPERGTEIVEALRIDGQWRGETLLLDAEGRTLPVLLSINSVLDEHGVRRGNVALVADVSEARRAADRLREMALTDPLTGLPNYAGFEPLLEQAIDAAAASGSQVAVAFIDLDRLKSMNDLFGHRIGDQAIRTVAAHLRAGIPGQGVVARRSGDEFLLFAPFSGAPDAVRDRIEALLDGMVLHDPELPNGRLTLSISVGVALWPQHARSIADLMVAADAALYEAKGQGRGRVAWYDAEYGRSTRRRLQIESRLRIAIAERSLAVAYQPEIDLRDGRVIGFEALARWRDDVLGEVSPAEFIPIAEDAKLIDGMFDTVLGTVLADLPALGARFPGIRIAVNVSPKQLGDDRLVRLLAAHTKDRPEIGRMLDIEITESDLARDEAGIAAQLGAIAELGAGIAIDDFGQGYSSLARLTSLPISRLKIDRAFVSGLETPSRRAIVRAILALAEATGLEVTAEGVETRDQLVALRQLGCVRGQGWLFARALAFDDAIALAPMLPGAWACTPVPPLPGGATPHSSPLPPPRLPDEGIADLPSPALPPPVVPSPPGSRPFAQSRLQAAPIEMPG